jgi:pimeloyl-ACP methyl ester carboxylesterase
MNTVLLIHGFPLSRTMWNPQLEAIKAAGWLPIAPNLPGFGGAPLVQHTSMDTYADCAFQSLVAVGVKRAVIVGLSMGGYVAFRFLEKYPDVVSGLVLVDTRAGADTDESRAGRHATAARVEREGVSGLANDMLGKLVAPQATQAVKDELLEVMRSASAAGTAAAARAMAARPDSRPMLEQVGVPTLIVVGAEDALTPPAMSEEMHKLVPGSRLEVIPGVGHMSNMEAPEAFNRVLLEFLQGV